MIKIKYWIITLLLLFLSESGWSQSELSFKSGYELPHGELKWVYKPTLSYSLSYSYISEGRRGHSSAGIGLGYLSFTPKQDIFYYLLSDTEYGTVTYSSYKMLQLFCPIRVDYELGKKKHEFFYGVNVGYYYIYYQYQDKNSFASVGATTVEGKGAIAPKLGFNIKLSKKLGIVLESKYNFYFSIGKTNPSSASYNPNVGSVNALWSNNVGIFVRL